MKETREQTENRFWKHVKANGDCLEWASSKNHNGYGRFGLNNKVIRAHRMSWILAHGEIPGGLLVLHRCDNRSCVNPNHLFLGTAKDNTHDCMKKGRHMNMTGECNQFAKLSPESVKYMRHLYWAERRTPEELAEFFGCKKNNIANVVYRRTWKHI